MKHFFLVLLLMPVLSVAQSLESKTLLSIDGKDYDAGTFMRVYQKNLDIVQDEDQKDIDNYLQLYIDYRLKLQEAYNSRLDTFTDYKKEIKKYRSSLAEGFLTDNKVTKELVDEAIERAGFEVNASHILILVDEAASPADTLKAWNKAYAIKKELDEGADFAMTARNKSEGPSAKVKGELGWFGPFKMIYEFESQAYNTPVGQYTDPFRTSFGYHILKVNQKRPARGELTVAHIMTFDKPKDSVKTAADRIQTIYKQLEEGGSFEELAREFSDDLNSAQNGGKLNKFSTGDINSPVFEDQAFALKNPGDYTAPFQTKFGWHIIKLLIKHPRIKEDLERKQLEEKIMKSPRSRQVNDAFISTLAAKYNFELQQEAPSFLLKKVNDSLLTGQWRYDDKSDEDTEVLFSIQDKDITANAFLVYASKNQRIPSDKTLKDRVDELYKNFQEQELIAYYDENLERDNEDFRFIYSEFKEGILLFNLLEKKIWQKAKTDSLGQMAYYNSHKDRYKWNRRIDLTIVQTTSDSVAREVRKMMVDGIKLDSIKAKFNNGKRTRVIVSNGTVEETYSRLPKNFELKEGISKVYHSKADSFHKIIEVHRILEPAPKSFEEARGAVINDYQQEIEDQWERSLRDGHKIKINKKVLKKIKQEFES